MDVKDKIEMQRLAVALMSVARQLDAAIRTLEAAEVATKLIDQVRRLALPAEQPSPSSGKAAEATDRLRPVAIAAVREFRSVAVADGSSRVLAVFDRVPIAAPEIAKNKAGCRVPF